MARAVYEGVAVNIKWALTHFEKLVSGEKRWIKCI